MSDKPSSPFTGLGRDKALLRSTRQPEPQETVRAPDQNEGDTPPDRVAPLPDSERTLPGAAAPSADMPVQQTSIVPKSDSTIASKRDSKQASKLASVIAPVPDAPPPDVLIATIRKAVKVSGKEVSFNRLTPEEKRQLADIVYTYKRQGKRTSENEITRIAVNFILEDYHAHGEQSILARVIASLLA